MRNHFDYRYEELSAHELLFMKRRLREEVRSWVRISLVIIAIFGALSGLIFFSEQHANTLVEKPEDEVHFTVPAIKFLGGLVAFLVIAPFARYALPYVQDVFFCKKTIATLPIQRMQHLAGGQLSLFLPHPYFYLVTVAVDDSRDFAVGQEINIEYSKYSKEFFGYF